MTRYTAKCRNSERLEFDELMLAEKYAHSLPAGTVVVISDNEARPGRPIAYVVTAGAPTVVERLGELKRPRPMLSIALSAFPWAERETIRRLLAEHGLSPAQFYIVACVPKVDAPGLTARIVYVDHLPTKAKRQYQAAPGKNWLASFAKDLRNGFQPPH